MMLLFLLFLKGGSSPIGKEPPRKQEPSILWKRKFWEYGGKGGQRSKIAGVLTIEDVVSFAGNDAKTRKRKKTGL